MVSSKREDAYVRGTGLQEEAVQQNEGFLECQRIGLRKELYAHANLGGREHLLKMLPILNAPTVLK